MKTPTLDKTELEIVTTDIVFRWGRDMIEWECKLTYKDYESTVMFYTHETRTDDPTVEEVVYALYADDVTIENSTGFSDWCDTLGYNDDSISDQQTYELCKENSLKVRQLFGSDYSKIIKEMDQ
jgi:hypothetical protein